jgi:hypothetical protein
MREITVRVQQDLAGTTMPAQPWSQNSSALGYTEVREGPCSDIDADNDGNADATQSGANTALGDLDDVVSFTARTTGEPFVGYVLGWFDRTNTNELVYDPDATVYPTDARYRSVNPIASDLAEIVYFTVGTTLYRRVLLIRPDITIATRLGGGPSPLQPINPEMPDVFFFSANDLSVRTQRVNNVPTRITNSLADLTRREARFAHDSTTFPYAMDLTRLTPKVSVWRPGSDSEWGRTGDDDGDGTSNELDEAGTIGSDDFLVYGAVGTDVMAVNVLAFDARVYDPTARLLYDTSNSELLLPGDPGYAPSAGGQNTQVAGQGAYADLGYAYTTYARNENLNTRTNLASTFSALPMARSQLTVPTYDTWSLHYEKDGVDQDQDNVIDEGTDGRDNDGLRGVDDVGERETLPPYPWPLRGLQIRLRMLEPDSRHVRQESIVTSFVHD